MSAESCGCDRKAGWTCAQHCCPNCGLNPAWVGGEHDPEAGYCEVKLMTNNRKPMGTISDTSTEGE